jgi:hypothetical protein
MTVSTTIIKNFHNGNGSTTNFAYQFRILEDTDLLVIIRTNSTGAEATKTLATHYTVAGAGDASGGSITFMLIVQQVLLQQQLLVQQQHNHQKMMQQQT